MKQIGVLLSQPDKKKEDAQMYFDFLFENWDVMKYINHYAI